jgi:hypothetical protein
MNPQCYAADYVPSWRSKLQNGSIFFPYAWCLAFKVLSVDPHTASWSGDCANQDVKVMVEYVVRDGTQIDEFAEHDRFDNRKAKSIRQGDILTFCLAQRTNPYLNRTTDSLTGKTQVWAFDAWSSKDGKSLNFDIEDHFEPFKNQEFSNKDLKKFANALKKTITNPDRAKRPVEKYLRERWPENRIREFCHKENRLIFWKATPEPDVLCWENRRQDFYLRGILYPKTASLGEVCWFAWTVNKIPTRYGVVVKRGTDIWQLDISNFDLASVFTDDDALTKRIYDTLHYAREKSFNAHLRAPIGKEEANRSGVFSSTKLSVLPDWQAFTVERDASTGNVIGVNCETANGRLKVHLDTNKDIQVVTVNGKRDLD